MAYSLLKSILIAVKCINILKNNTESSIFTFLLSQTPLLKRCLPSPTLAWPTQNSEKYESWCHRCQEPSQSWLGNSGHLGDFRHYGSWKTRWIQWAPYNIYIYIYTNNIHWMCLYKHFTSSFWRCTSVFRKFVVIQLFTKCPYCLKKLKC